MNRTTVEKYLGQYTAWTNKGNLRAAAVELESAIRALLDMVDVSKQDAKEEKIVLVEDVKANQVDAPDLTETEEESVASSDETEAEEEKVDNVAENVNSELVSSDHVPSEDDEKSVKAKRGRSSK